jgi:hypothetical protein
VEGEPRREDVAHLLAPRLLGGRLLGHPTGGLVAAADSQNCDGMASTTASFFSITSVMSTTISPVNGFGFWKRSSEKRKTGLRAR